MTKPDRIEQRVDALFDDAKTPLGVELRNLKLSRVQNGATSNSRSVFPIVDAIDSSVADVLRDCLKSVAVLAPTTGTKRTKALEILDRRLDFHLAELKRRAASECGQQDSLLSVLDAAWIGVEKRARKIVDDFRQGWTAPTAKRWHERHPALFATSMAGVGVGLKMLGDWIYRHL